MSRMLHCRLALLPAGWVQGVNLQLSDRGVIESSDTGNPPIGAEIIDGPVIPGMPNLHSHGFQYLIRGLTGRRAVGDDSFWTWREQMYGMAERIDAAQMEALMGGVFLDMLLGGYTSCAEFHYLHHRPDGQAHAEPAELGLRVMAAAESAGIGLTHLPVLYSRSGFDADQVNARQRRFNNDNRSFMEIVSACRKVATGSDRISVGVAPHSLRAVAPEQLDELLAAIPEDMPVHIHVAEQPLEVEECLAKTGSRPVDWLLDHQDINSRWCLVHATHMTSEESRRAAACGAVAGLCPTTEADLGDGIFRFSDWRAARGRFGVGSDSNLRLDAAEELRLLEFGQRLLTGKRNVLASTGESNGRWLWTRAAAGGAQALGQPVGSLAPGRRADLLELDHEHPLLHGLDQDELLDTFVFGGDRQMIRSVRIAGQQWIEQGRHIHHDSLRAGGNRVLKELRG